jgi:uracil-DNA glycosylase
VEAPADAGPWVPASGSVADLRAAAAGCRGCELWRRGTRTVFGEGPEAVPMMLVGEQPGDQEDLAGQPFVGPAGRLLDRALADAGIDRGAVYVTNAVKHFKWTPKGPRRIHQAPSEREIAACRPWLRAEIAAVGPRIVVALGATAGRSLLGPGFRVTRSRGMVLEPPDLPAVAATVHPSSILRTPQGETRREAYRAFVVDLEVAAAALG